MSSSRASTWNKLGDAAYAKSEKVSADLVALTYGSFVREIIKDFEEPDQVNKELEKLGYNIGIRLIEDFLAKSGISNCSSFEESAEIISRVAFKMFLGIRATVSNWNSEHNSCSIIFDENPLAEYVELPPEYTHSLFYSNLLCGVIRGALEMVQIIVECEFVKDQLRGDDTNEINIRFKEMLQEQVPWNDEE
ncbi:Trafficking protein particle complex subunit 3 [Galdieria sulphuraria]|uniref:Trafficking protein particle complex subunit n=1 Tax=Galdieria sulphuraria TaxID=130081 RepID=M2WZZ6_GALSU|nr:BET3 vesicular transport protein [Galdieria sulphuraria]EME29655.1 BET3 vesicular transport protein [Galdieria sulphuraria]GJD12194.1 Trafficking protein particle complex subunit 3 [Galdieria sulphuraria]|eukprot:XP_005706175.1 BET3 vesicular transport protein [Galdieria sulphuraria]